MDVLTDVLESVRLRSTVFCRSELTAPWGFRVGRTEAASFHVVQRGAAWLDVEGLDKPIALAGGDLVILPHGAAHVIRDNRRTAAPPLEKILAHGNQGGPFGTLVHGGGGAETTLVCGCFHFEDRSVDPLFRALPPLLHVRGEEGRAQQWLEMTLQFVAFEVASSPPGARTIVSRLCDVIFIKAVRAFVSSLPADDGGWLRALSEPQIGAALALIHDAPSSPWTVADLASKVGMSRSAFAARFTTLIGEPPLAYLTRWRIQKAASALRAGRRIAEIAPMVGYDSEASFSKAFKRVLGTAPGAYRAGAVAS